MDTRSGVQWIVTFFFMVAGFNSTLFAGPTLIYGGDFDLPIPALDDPMSEYGRGWMDDAVIEIPDHFTICDLDVRISFTHESLFDLQIVIRSPAGTSVALNLAGNFSFIVRGKDGRLTTVGGSGEWLFDDEAQVSIEQAKEPFFGSFRPVESLSLFDKEDAFGPWRLQIHDAFYAHTGNLESFEVMITVCEPATATLVVLGVGLVTLFSPRRKR